MAIVTSITHHHSSGGPLLPSEIWDNICSLLPKSSLFWLRLVSSQFEPIARPWVFRNLRLEGFGDSSERFVEIAKSPQLRNLVRDLTVDTSVSPEYAYKANWGYPFPTSFIDALPYLRCFTHLTALHLRFNEYCGEDDRRGVTVEETWDFRYSVLDTVCHCVAGMWTPDKQIEFDKKGEYEWYHYTRKSPDPEDDLGVPLDQVIQLKEFTVTHLADFHHPDLANSGAFKKIMSLPSLIDLKLLIAIETDMSLHDHIAYYEEKYDFFDHLPGTWLAPSISDNLRVLSLYCADYWGWLPKMDFRGMEFPRLKVLALGQYVFSHDWQIDWIASIGQENGSSGLEKLYLDDCPILFQALQASPLDENDPGYPSVSTILAEAETEMFKYSMRWHHVLPRWTTSMKALKVFRMGHGEWRGAPEDTLQSAFRDFRHVDEDILRYRLSYNMHRSFNCPEPLEKGHDNGHPNKVWESGMYANGTGINSRRACKLQYIKYDHVCTNPWFETSRPHLHDEEGFEPEEGTWDKDLAAYEAFCSSVNARASGQGGE
ncbi:hypothetical protein CEP54_003682 [Fusarium duplospermum]|uniref:F-box domain-containing protein n=1 Tax=Fusarium duplospermum TaxID=1325734 RepID=A0A428QMR9_9HYPO|nr:hypothetical protein CEP54_003682 [Fusarium duplospermum]